MNITLSLTGELERYVESQIESGRYRSSGEVIVEALRLLESHERTEAAKLQWLREAWQTGIASGDAGEVDFETLKHEVRRLTPAKA